jgi:hypothetical protein
LFEQLDNVLQMWVLEHIVSCHRIFLVILELRNFVFSKVVFVN